MMGPEAASATLVATLQKPRLVSEQRVYLRGLGHKGHARWVCRRPDNQGRVLPGGYPIGVKS